MTGSLESERPVLFMSNGYGEDAIAAQIVREVLAHEPSPRVLAMPLVGAGQAYDSLGIEIVGPRQLMPSGGLILGGWLNLVKDMMAGLWRMTVGQMSVLRALRGRLGAVVAVGDTYPVLLGALCTRERVIMVGTAKSDYFCAYSPLEQVIFRRCCEVVFARDEPTAVTLRAGRVHARWVGNAMMDSLQITGQTLPSSGDRLRVGVLPGSRQVAFRDLPIILDGLMSLAKLRPVHAAMALPDSIATPDLGRVAAEAGWTVDLDPTRGPGLDGSLRRDGVEVLLVRGRLGDVVEQSVLVIGQAGTGNEQAVGMGRPVIGFDSDGRRRLGWYRARQKGLLGDALAVVDRSGEAIAREALAILDDGERYKRMQEEGCRRMGPPGGSRKMAETIIEHARRRGPLNGRP